MFCFGDKTTVNWIPNSISSETILGKLFECFH